MFCACHVGNHFRNYSGNYLGNYNENLRENHFCGIIFNGYPLGINHREMLLDILPVKLLEKHLESIGETLFKTAFGSRPCAGQWCRARLYAHTHSGSAMQKIRSLTPP
jgi:hypothetical protein